MTDSPLSNPLPHPILLETDLLPPGFVNPDCSFIVEGGKRFILLKGIVLFAYDARSFVRISAPPYSALFHLGWRGFWLSRRMATALGASGG